jgi:hypothetical protein
MPSDFQKGASSQDNAQIVSAGTSAVAQSTHTLIVEINDWFVPDMAKLKDDAFALARKTQLQVPLAVRLNAPKYRELQAFIETQARNNKNPDIAAEQLQALARAKRGFEATEKWCALLVVHMTRHYGLRRALRSCGYFLRQRLMKIISDLASYQVDEGDVVCLEFVQWFDRHHTLPTLAQSVYGCSLMLEVIVGEDPSVKERPKADTVFLPLERIANTDSGILFTNLPESAVPLPSNVWIDYVVPQLTALQAADVNSYHAWTPGDATYLTEGILWRASERLIGEEELNTHVSVVKRDSYEPPDAAEEARQYLECLTDPPVKHAGPFRFFPPETDLPLIQSAGNEILSAVTAVDERTWRAPSVWHAAIWLKNNAAGVAEGKEIRTSFPNVPPATKFAGPLLFKAGTNSELDLQLRTSLSTADDGPALLRLMLALNSLNLKAEQAGLPSLIMDAIVGVAEHYGLSTYLLPVTLDPLVAILESTELAVDGEAAVYWIPLHKINSLGGRLILAPIWAESLYEKKEAFVDFREVALSEIRSECWRLLFPVDKSYLDFEFPLEHVDRNTTTDDVWFESARLWARNSKIEISPDQVEQKGELLAEELCSQVGTPLFVSASGERKILERWSIRFANVLKWLMLKRDEGVYHFDCYPIRLLSTYTYSTLTWFVRFNDEHQNTLSLSEDYVGSETARVANSVGICLRQLEHRGK